MDKVMGFPATMKAGGVQMRGARGAATLARAPPPSLPAPPSAVIEND